MNAPNAGGKPTADFEKGMQGLEAVHVCDQCDDDHAEGHDADPETHAEKEEVQVFKAYFYLRAIVLRIASRISSCSMAGCDAERCVPLV